MNRISRTARPGLTAVCWALATTLALVTVSPALAAGPELAAVTAEAPALLQRLERAHVGSVAVVDFTDLGGRTTELGRFLAEKLSGELANGSSDIRVIDRLNLAAVLKEHKLEASGLTDPKTLHEIGKISGVEALVTGQMTALGDRIQVTVLAIQTESAQTLASHEIEIPRTETIAALERRTLTDPCPPGPRPPTLALEGPWHQKLQSGGLEFVLYACRRVNDTIECGITVRNLEDERNLLVNGKSQLVFGEGSQVEASQLFLNGEWATGALSRVGSPILPGVTSTLGVVFEGVPESVETVRLLELDLYGPDIRFEDIPIGR